MGDTQGKKFLFTGKLASMTRSQAQSWVTEAGGTNAGSVSKDLDYLVIGDDGSFLFGAGTKGDKTLAAEKLIANGAGLKIISETAFLEMVKAPPPEESDEEKFEEGPWKATSADDGAAFDAKGKKFLFTGKLASMTRGQAEARVKSLGGVNAGSVSKDLDYLVIGDQGSPLFGAGAKGDKMLAAERLIEDGAALQIIAESAFMEMSGGSGGGGGGGGGKAKPAAKTSAPKKASKPKPKPKAKAKAVAKPKAKAKAKAKAKPKVAKKKRK